MVHIMGPSFRIYKTCSAIGFKKEYEHMQLDHWGPSTSLMSDGTLSAFLAASAAKHAAAQPQSEQPKKRGRPRRTVSDPKPPSEGQLDAFFTPPVALPLKKLKLEPSDPVLPDDTASRKLKKQLSTGSAASSSSAKGSSRSAQGKEKKNKLQAPQSASLHSFFAQVRQTGLETVKDTDVCNGKIMPGKLSPEQFEAVASPARNPGTIGNCDGVPAKFVAAEATLLALRAINDANLLSAHASPAPASHVALTAMCASPARSCVRSPTVSPGESPASRKDPPNELNSSPASETARFHVAQVGIRVDYILSPDKAPKDPQPNQRFAGFGANVWTQYHAMYASRLRALRKEVEEEARYRWGCSVPTESFSSTIQHGCKIGRQAETVIVGVLFKDMIARPNAVDMCRNGDDASQHTSAGVLGGVTNLCSDRDVLWLEDATLRVKLNIPQSSVDNFATGFVVAVRGVFDGDDNFHGSDVCFAQPLAPPLLPAIPPSESPSQGQFVAFISGLGLPAYGERSASLDRAVQFLLGQSADGSLRLLSEAVKLLVVCGDTFPRSGASVASIAAADELFHRIAQVIPIDLLPGANDPTNASLPQTPLHPHLFPHARRSGKFRSVSNPFECCLDGLRLLGHSGQPVHDLLHCTRLSSPLEALALCLDSLHLAPTAPDTLAAPPFANHDPFVITEAPHVLFSGGHAKEAYRWKPVAAASHSSSIGNALVGTLCLCVPAFQERAVLALVNMRDPRDVRLLNFDEPSTCQPPDGRG